MNPARKKTCRLFANVFIVFAVFMICLLTLCAVANRAKGQEESICRVFNHLNGYAPAGTGTVVDKRDGLAFVLTCWHVFCEGTGNVEVIFPGGNRRIAKVLGTNERYDLAALMINDPGVPALPIAEPFSDEVRVCGYGGSEGFLAAPGRILGLCYREGIGDYDISTPARSGDSGGPLLDSQNRVCGVVIASSKTQASAVHTKYLTQFVGQYGVQCGPCQNGVCRPQQPQAVRPSQPQVVPPTPAPVQSCNCAEKWTAFESRIEYLEQEIKLARETAGQPGPQGERGAPGPVGPAGKDGATGPPGANAEINYAEIAANLQHSATLTMPDGTMKTQTVPLSEPLQFIRQDLQPK